MDAILCNECWSHLPGHNKECSLFSGVTNVCIECKAINPRAPEDHVRGCSRSIGGYMPDGTRADVAVYEESELIATPAEEKHELTLRNVEALEDLADGVCAISNFLCNGGLTKVLSGYARTQAVKDILGGLAAHDGRAALDARILPQNALEIVEQVEMVFRKYTERLQETNRDPEIHEVKE